MTALLPSSTARIESSPSPRVRHSIRTAAPFCLEERVDYFRKQHVLGEQNLALHDFERRLGIPPQNVIAAPTEDLYFVLQPVLVGVELGGDLDGIALLVEDLDVRDEVLEPRDRFLRPVHAGVDLPNPPGQDVLALVEIGDLTLRVRVLEVPVAELDVAPNGHEVVQVLGEEIEPFGVSAL